MNSSHFTAPRKLQPPMTIQPCARKCVHWNLRRKMHSLARSAGSPRVFLAKSGLGTTRTAGTFPSGRPSSAPLLVNVSQSLLPSPPNPTPEQHAGATSSSLTCTAITLAHVKVTQVLPNRTIGWLPCLVLSSGPPGTRLRQGITPRTGLKRADIEIIDYLSDSAGSRNLVIDHLFLARHHKHLFTHARRITSPSLSPGSSGD
jgi:hypothetical protein